MSYRLPSVSNPASRSISSTCSEPVSVSVTDLAFSSFSNTSSRLTNSMTTESTLRYKSVASSEGPEMISGVRASSIRIESTSSTMA